jgi:hypothetical protein
MSSTASRAEAIKHRADDQRRDRHREEHQHASVFMVSNRRARERKPTLAPMQTNLT